MNPEKLATVSTFKQLLEDYAKRGEISFVGRIRINWLREKLEISSEEALQIENEVFEPYRQYEKQLETYRSVLDSAFMNGHLSLAQER